MMIIANTMGTKKTSTDNELSDRFMIQALNLGLLMDEARHYLMSIDLKSISTEQMKGYILEKLGFGRNGLESNFLTE